MVMTFEMHCVLECLKHARRTTRRAALGSTQGEEKMRTAMMLTLRAAMTLTLALTSLAAPQAQVPFKGVLQGQETDVVQGSQILVDGDVAGTATQLGRFTMTYNVTVSLPAGTSTGSAELTAANGDVISTTLVGLGVPTDTPG